MEHIDDNTQYLAGTGTLYSWWYSLDTTAKQRALDACGLDMAFARVVSNTRVLKAVFNTVQPFGKK